MMPRTLYGRMLAVSAVATLLALAIAGAVIASVLGRFVTEGLDRRLDAEVLLLASVVDGDGHVDRDRLRARAAALQAGPDWRWRIAGPDGVIGSQDFPALGDGPPGPPGPLPGPGAGPGPHPREGALEDGVAVHARELTIDTRRGPVTLTAAAPRDVVQRPIRGALAPLLIALAVLAALLTAALLVQLRIGLRPLRRLADEVAAIRTGRATRVDEDQPAELRPLAVELNALAADNAAALATARASAANLAHALKTPVATLAVDLRDQPRQAAQVARIDRTIRHHLARARAAAINRRTATPLRPAVTDLVTAVRRIAGEHAPAVAIDIADDLAVAVDPQDVDELFGNLLDNAVRHATSQVMVAARREDRMVAITVGDDGPGIPPAERARVAQPGTRLDERGDGHGFGLAIVAELAALYGGTMALDEAPGGGLAVRLLLPAA
jgi:signal transduction histidine kinase